MVASIQQVLFEEIGDAIADSKRGSMFGVLCYKYQRKPFILFYQGQIVCKLFGAAREEALELPGTSLFNPKKHSRPMGNWVQLPIEIADSWACFAHLASEFAIADY